jgi:DNA-binding NarL/FixJ family response regulator
MSVAKPAIRVLIVDDHPVVRYGLRHMIDAERGFVVVGDFGDINDACATLGETRPDVVLLDLELGELRGVEALRCLRRASPACRVLIYTAYADEERVVQVAELGVHGYLLKGCPNQELVRAVRTVYLGGTVLEPSVAAKLMRRFNLRSERVENAPAESLSEREIEVLGRLAEGKSNRSIAESLFVCEATVKYHVHAIMKKLRAGNRTEAVLIAAQRGMIDLRASV